MSITAYVFDSDGNKISQLNDILSLRNYIEQSFVHVDVSPPLLTVGENADLEVTINGRPAPVFLRCRWEFQNLIIEERNENKCNVTIKANFTDEFIKNLFTDEGEYQEYATLIITDEFNRQVSYNSLNVPITVSNFEQ